MKLHRSYGHVAEDSQVREEVKMLEDHSHLLPELIDISRRRHDVIAVECYGAACGAL